MERKINQQQKLHIKKGDMVLVLAGDDKGKKGRIVEVLKADGRALVEGVNIVSRHTKQEMPPELDAKLLTMENWLDIQRKQANLLTKNYEYLQTKIKRYI
jgi:ribosomal protein L24